MMAWRGVPKGRTSGGGAALGRYPGLRGRARQTGPRSGPSRASPAAKPCTSSSSSHTQISGALGKGGAIRCSYRARVRQPVLVHSVADRHDPRNIGEPRAPDRSSRPVAHVPFLLRPVRGWVLCDIAVAPRLLAVSGLPWASIVFVYGERPFYAQVKRDGGLLNLKCVDYPVTDPELRDRASLLSPDMEADTAEETKQLFLEF